MIKRKFGMACLNISQSRYGAYSHALFNAYDLAGMDAGIDRFRTFCDLEVIGIHTFKRTGFANTVHFYDAENGVTIAMTHENAIPSDCTLNHVYHSGDTVYYEGTTGRATGNHIHLEIGKGYQPSKVKFSGGWKLLNWINIEDYFFIDSAYTTIKDSKGITFTGSEETTTAQFIDGYQLLNWQGAIVHVYRQKKNQKLTMKSAHQSGVENYRAVQDIVELAIDTDCAINCNYFEMQNQSIYGTHYGVEFSDINEFAPKQKDWLVAYEQEKLMHWLVSDAFWLAKADALVAFSPAIINVAEDIKNWQYSPACGTAKYTNKNTQTLLMQDADGFYSMAVFSQMVNGKQCTDFAKAYGQTFACMLDSGGSSQMIVAGEKKVYTGRNLPNVLAFVTAEEETPTETMPDNEAPSVTPSEPDTDTNGETGTYTSDKTETPTEPDDSKPDEDVKTSALMVLLKKIFELLQQFFKA